MRFLAQRRIEGDLTDFSPGANLLSHLDGRARDDLVELFAYESAGRTKQEGRGGSEQQ